MLLNIFHSGGLWLIPFITLFASIYLFYTAYRMSKSGSVIGGSSSDPVIRDGGGNVPIYKTWAFWWGLALLVVSVYSFISIGGDYKGV